MAHITPIKLKNLDQEREIRRRTASEETGIRELTPRSINKLKYKRKSLDQSSEELIEKAEATERIFREAYNGKKSKESRGLIKIQKTVALD